MTGTEIDALPAGRELDALVAEKVMGLHVEKAVHVIGWQGAREVTREEWELRDDHGNPVMVHGPMMHGYFACPVAHYSTDIAAAWEVFEHINQIRDGDLAIAPGHKPWDRWVILQDQGGDDGYQIFGGGESPAEAPTAPLAICRAALKAVGL